MARLVFSDNDVLLKLAAYDLLDDTLTLFGVTPSSVRVLPSFIPILRRRAARFEEQCTRSGLIRLKAFLATAGAVTTVTSDVPSGLSGVEALDAGEVLLITDAWRNPESLLATGDKRALRALAASAPARHVYTALTGRVTCLESIIQALLRSKGLFYVAPRIHAAPRADQALSGVFAPGPATTLRAVRLGLGRLIRNLEDDIGKGWLRALI